MATSLLLMASDQDKAMKPPPPLCGSSEEPPKTETSRNRGRKANHGKGPNQKKQPQRGMGVAQLEILRVQETLKKMHETCSAVPPPPLLSPFAIHDPSFASNLPLNYGASANHEPLQCPPPLPFNGNAVIPGGSGQGPAAGNPNNTGFNIAFGGGGGGCSYGFGAPAWSPFIGSPMETSRELSSMPNEHYESERCDLCFKKKRFNDDNIVKGSNTRRDKAFDIWPIINGSHFLGFAPQQTPSLPAETIDFTSRLTTQNASSYRNLDECVGVVAVHRKVNSRNGKVLMEYEFFPGKDYGRGTTSKELEFSTVVGGEASSSSYSITAAARVWNADTTTASNSVDLSLKL